MRNTQQNFYRFGSSFLHALQWWCIAFSSVWMMLDTQPNMYGQAQKPPQTKQPQAKTTQTNNKPTVPVKEIPTPQQDAQEEMVYGGYPLVLPPIMSPDKQWSGGVQMSAPFLDVIGSPAGGISVGYALLPAVHVGMVAGIASHTDTAVGTQYAVGIFGRLIFRTPTVKPIAELMMFAGSTRTTDSLGARVAQLGYGLRLNLGAQYFITQHVSIRSTFALFNVQLQTGGTHQFGIFAPTVGIEWFF
jgi:hypothetical protein